MNFLNNLMAGLQRLFYGRNGFDHLTFAVFIVSFLIRLIARLFWIPWIGYLYYVGLAYALFRMFSRNIYQRQKENAWFLNLIHGFSSASRTRKANRQAQQNYNYLKCPGCGQQLRVPRGAGTVNITCPKCGSKVTKTV